jgi:heme exporter protein D
MHQMALFNYFGRAVLALLFLCVVSVSEHVQVREMRKQQLQRQLILPREVTRIQAIHPP